MKHCPKCYFELPEEAVFCPRCTYEYPRHEIQIKHSGKKRTNTAVITLIIIIIVLLFFATLLILHLIQLNNTVEPDMKVNKTNSEDDGPLTQEEVESLINEYFRTGRDVPYNVDILYDMRNGLNDYDSVWTIFGIKPQETYEKDDYLVYKFEVAELYTKDEEVEYVYINYADADDEIKTQYGIYGFNGHSTREEIKAIMGTPDQNYGDKEWYYRFDGLLGAPSLGIVFDENGVVIEFYYYTLS